MPSAPTIRLELKPSKTQSRLSWAVVIVALLSVLLAPWPFLWRLAGLLLLAGVWVFHRRQGDRAIVPEALEWRGDGAWWAWMPGTAEPVQAALRRSRVVGPMIALELRGSSTPALPRTLVLWPDSADPSQLRRLRIRLARRSHAEAPSRF